MLNMKKTAYLKLAEADSVKPYSLPVAGVAERQLLVNCLVDLSDVLGDIRRRALNELDVKSAKTASNLQLRVDFMILHIDQEIIELIDNSSELAAVQTSIDRANKGLNKIKTDTAALATNLGTAANILGEFEKLVDWIKKQ